MGMSMSMPSSFANRKSSLKIAVYRFQPYIRSINEPSRSELCTFIACACVCVDGAPVCVRVWVYFSHYFLAYTAWLVHLYACAYVEYIQKYTCLWRERESTGETVNLSRGQITQYLSMHTWLMLTAMCIYTNTLSYIKLKLCGATHTHTRTRSRLSHVWQEERAAAERRARGRKRARERRE